MSELLTTAVTGVNIIPTVLLGLVVLYWLAVIIGAMDMDFLDVDVEVDSESLAGPFYGILAFLHVAHLPLMLVFSILILVLWALSMLMHLLPFETGGLVSGILLVPNFIISILVTKAVTFPLKNVFKDTYQAGNTQNVVLGKVCTLLCDVAYGRLGQGEVEREGASIIINVKVQEGDELKKGDKALVIKKDRHKDFYIIKKFEGVR